MKPFSVADERGNILPLVVASVFALIAVLAFSVDQAVAYAAKDRQENALDSARTACMDASFALVAKNDDDPGRAVAEQVGRTVRNEGFEGRVSVWFYEVPAEELPASKRMWVIGMQLEEVVPTVFARGFGLEGLPVASHRSLSATPYSADTAWRPSKRACGRFEIAAGREPSRISFALMEELDAFPAELAADVRGALASGSDS